MSGFENPYGQNYATGGGARGGGGGGGFVSDSQDGGAKKTGSNSLRPLTIRQVINAEQAHSDSPIFIDGHEVVQITLVGVVRHINTFTTNVSYNLDDGSGSIEVKQWLESSSDDAGKTDGIEKNKYVRIIGQIKTFQSKRSINAGHIRPIEDPNEISFHRLEAMLTHLELTRGDKAENNANPYEAGNGGAYHDLGGGAGSGSKVPAEALRALTDPDHKAVITAIFDMKVKDDDDGVPIPAIAKRLPRIGEAGVRDAINHMLTEGLLYTAADDDHVLPT